MSSISIIPILIAILIIICVAYYFLYYNYINKRLADKCKKRRLPHPTTTVLYFVLLFSIIFNVIFCAELNKANEKNLDNTTLLKVNGKDNENCNFRRNV